MCVLSADRIRVLMQRLSVTEYIETNGPEAPNEARRSNTKRLSNVPSSTFTSSHHLVIVKGKAKYYSSLPFLSFILREEILHLNSALMDAASLRKTCQC